MTDNPIAKPPVRHISKDGFFQGQKKLENLERLKDTLREARETNARLKLIEDGLDGAIRRVHELSDDYRKVIDRVQNIADKMDKESDHDQPGTS